MWWLPVAFALPLPSTDAVPVVTERVWAGGTVAQVDWTWHGLPVDHGGGTIAIGIDGAVRRARLPAPALPASTHPEVTRAEAIAAVLPSQLWPARAQLVVYDGRLAWRVDTSTASPPRTWRVWVDATTGDLLGGQPTSFTAKGNVYPTDPLTSSLVEVDLGDIETLAGAYGQVFSCDEWLIEDGLFGGSDCLAWSAHALPDDNGDFYFDPDPASVVDPQAELQVYHHLDIVAGWFDERLGVRHDAPMNAYVNWVYANAFFGDFDGDGEGDVSFGQTEAGIDFAYDADVVYHEYGHSVVGAVSGLGSVWADEYGMVWTSGALNEGTADVYAMVLLGDPELAPYAGSGFGDGTEPIRHLEEDRSCPEALMGEVHYDGELWGALAWNLIEQVGEEVVTDLFFGALLTWGPETDWELAGASLRNAAGDLLAAEAIDQATHDIVLTEIERFHLEDCGRVQELADGDEVLMYLTNLALPGDFKRFPGGKQLHVEVPDGHELVVRVAWSAREEALGWAVLARRDQPVAHEVTTMPGIGLAAAIPTTWDREETGADDATFTLPAGDWYLSLAADNINSGLPIVDFHWGAVRMAFDIEAVDEQPEKKGCGCSGVSASWWLALLPLVALRKR